MAAPATTLAALGVEDLLGRPQHRSPVDAIRRAVAGKRVLITGAAGSIGSEIARRVAIFAPAALSLVDLDVALLRQVADDCVSEVDVLKADVRDGSAIRRAFEQRRPQVVVHAAAQKYIRVLERNPQEALKTNVLGTRNAAEAAVEAGVERFVFTSTHRAVKPESVMGASKWLAEQVLWTFLGRGTAFCAVRFGNVLGTRGSVLPVFVRQLERGGPITVTDPEMTRYFMSLEEAADLAISAADLAEDGEVLTLDMGRPVRIIDLARAVIVRSGRTPGRDIDIAITGAGDGEVAMEEVFDPAERPMAIGSVVVSHPVRRSDVWIERTIKALSALAASGRVTELVGRLRRAPFETAVLA